MDRDIPFSGTQSTKIVHVVGQVTDEVMSFLSPATNALGRAGHAQIVVMVDHIRFRHHLTGIHESVELKLTPHTRNPMRQWQLILRECRMALANHVVQAVHIHGIVPWLVSAWAMRLEGVHVPVMYSPHGSRSLGQLRSMGSLAILLCRPFLTPAQGAAIVNATQERLAFSDWKSVCLIESPVGQAFLDVARHEARHPLVVAGGGGEVARNTELFAQLAVLLSGDDLRISFNWIGLVDEVSRQRLNAAGVGIFKELQETERASRLAAGWIYVAPSLARGFPIALVEAMAAGLPCIALDCPQHRDVLIDGETGFLIETGAEMTACIARLVDDAALRLKVGMAARIAATDRFSESSFQVKLLAAYAANDTWSGAR